MKTYNKSLGALRPAKKTKPRSPDATGRIKIQKETLEILHDQLSETDNSEVLANLAGWKNYDSAGEYLTVELSPLFVSRMSSNETKGSFFGFHQHEEDNTE